MKIHSKPVLLLAGLAFVSCGRSEPSKPEQTRPSAPAETSGASPQLLALLPAKNEVPGWAMSQKPRSFEAANLYEFIDGAADGYLNYGFQEVVTADYGQEGTSCQAVIDVYQMRDPLNAFGIYAQERNPDSTFLTVGNEGYSGGTSVNFWTGQYYVKITTFDEKEAVRTEAVKLARAVAGKVTAPGAQPAEVSYFPPAGQKPHSVVYLAKDVLAQSYFYNGFEAKYDAGGKEYKLVFLTMDDAAAAQDALSLYRRYIGKSGKDVRDLKAPGEGGFSGKDSFYGTMAAVRAGKSIVVALGVPTDDAASKVISELLARAK